MNIRLSTGKVLPIEMHKIKIVQEVNLPNASERLRAIRDAGFNTFLLRTRDVFLDMLTDSGTNAMSDRQQAAMMVADDAYAGSESFYRLEDAVRDVLGFQWVMPVHLRQAWGCRLDELPFHNLKSAYRPGRREGFGAFRPRRVGNRE